MGLASAACFRVGYGVNVLRPRGGVKLEGALGLWTKLHTVLPVLMSYILISVESPLIPNLSLTGLTHQHSISTRIFYLANPRMGMASTLLSVCPKTNPAPHPDRLGTCARPGAAHRRVSWQ